MKKNYMAPAMEIKVFYIERIVTASFTGTPVNPASVSSESNDVAIVDYADLGFKF